MTRFAALALPLTLLGMTALTPPADAGFRPVEYVRLAQDALADGKYKKARRHASRALRASDSTAIQGAAYTVLCMADLQQEVRDAAIASCSAALDARPNNWRALNNRGLALMKAGDYKAAMADFEAAGAAGGDATLLAENMAATRQKLAQN